MSQFWDKRDEQKQSQEERGISDKGQRSEVTGGKHMDGFVQRIRDFLIDIGIDRECVFARTKLELPGYFRATKKWDMLVLNEGRVRAVLEMKSEIGESAGRNLNNRMEEALGSAYDFARSCEEKVFEFDENVWLGYFFLLEKRDDIMRRVNAREVHFNLSSEFKRSSYFDRFKTFCLRMVNDGLYSAVCLILSSKNERNELKNYNEPDACLSVRNFMFSLKSAVL